MASAVPVAMSMARGRAHAIYSNDDRFHDFFNDHRSDWMAHRSKRTGNTKSTAEISNAVNTAKVVVRNSGWSTMGLIVTEKRTAVINDRFCRRI